MYIAPFYLFQKNCNRNNFAKAVGYQDFNSAKADFDANPIFQKNIGLKDYWKAVYILKGVCSNEKNLVSRVTGCYDNTRYKKGVD